MRRAKSGNRAAESHSDGMSACARNGHEVSGQRPDGVEMVF